MKLHRVLAGVLALTAQLGFAQQALREKPLGLKLPTDNNKLYGSDPQLFYMYTYRNFEGKTSKPWTAGKYGYVRTLRRTGEGVIATKFHEGIDIRPVKRDAAGRPLDLIYAIADGKVVHTSKVAGNSNYGRYIVMEHDWGSGKFYSLYAHLDTVVCNVGQKVKSGSTIAKMGYTGAGINRERAHLHLELNVMTHTDFSYFHREYFGSKNHHKKYNGLNMNGLNIAELFLRHHKNPRISLTNFISKVPVYFKVTVPRKGPIDIATRYDWMRKGDHTKASPSWEISFASSGFPLAVTPSMRRVTKPTVTFVKPTKSNHMYHTKKLLSGEGSSASLTKLGLRTIALVAGTFSRVEPAPPVAIPVED